MTPGRAFGLAIGGSIGSIVASLVAARLLGGSALVTIAAGTAGTVGGIMIAAKYLK